MEWLFGPGIARLDRRTRRLARRVHRELYGLRRFDPSVLTRVYREHHAGVTEWFDGREDLLMIDLTAVGSKSAPWDLLCAFLDRPVPDAPFPRSNGRADPPPNASII